MVGILLLAVLQAAGMPSLHNFRSLSVSDGLSDLVVNACYKDRQGVRRCPAEALPDKGKE